MWASMGCDTASKDSALNHIVNFFAVTDATELAMKLKIEAVRTFAVSFVDQCRVHLAKKSHVHLTIPRY